MDDYTFITKSNKMDKELIMTVGFKDLSEFKIERCQGRLTCRFTLGDASKFRELTKTMTVLETVKVLKSTEWFEKILTLENNL